ncbi:beta-eliminating lyase-related protein [Parendozoicomonas sp. Alg238-R29]|uniref:threonine aldolase family protein n=1 Tax=Parendozoicomonas sp. Alg238-R29 TaxID=2993446 RepID=UPI00248E1662|nr:beta-eliminating lyase-related protein [Parendozoicomonas sp. Alg238-R29]
MISFASDNYATALPAVLSALSEANVGHVPAYGNDPITKSAVSLVQEALNTTAPVYFVGTGTAANTLALKVMLKDFQSVIAPDTAHIVTHETGAPAHICGTKLLTAPCENGKIAPETMRELYNKEAFWGIHSTEPKVLSISQPTEFGTVYTLDELAAIRSICNELGLLIHMDGCRLYNAAATLNCSLAELAQYADILCLGGSKAGLMFGEAMVFINHQLGEHFGRQQKLGLQLASKMRFVSAQFQALFTDDLGMVAAAHANRMTQRLWQGLENRDQVEAAFPVESNQMFVTLPQHIIAPLQKAYPFYVCDEQKNLVRLITSHDTTEQDVDGFLILVDQLLD